MLWLVNSINVAESSVGGVALCFPFTRHSSFPLIHRIYMLYHANDWLPCGESTLFKYFKLNSFQLKPPSFCKELQS